MAEHLLSDAQMRHFIVNGFVTVTTELPVQFHDADLREDDERL